MLYELLLEYKMVGRGTKPNSFNMTYICKSVSCCESVLSCVKFVLCGVEEFYVTFGPSMSSSIVLWCSVASLLCQSTLWVITIQFLHALYSWKLQMCCYYANKCTKIQWFNVRKHWTTMFPHLSDLNSTLELFDLSTWVDF